MKRLLLLLTLVAPIAYGQTITNQANLARFSAKLNGGEADVGVQTYGVNGGYSLWSPQGHANWNVVQTSVAQNPTEWQVYPNASQGIAQSQSGTNQLVRISGTAFSATWVGLPYIYFAGTQYKVATVSDSSHMTVQTTGGGAVTFGSTVNDTFFFVATIATATCNTSGTAVTWTAGQPFIPFIDLFYVNGVSYTASYSSQTSITLGSSAGTQTGVTCVTYKNINNELTALRLQGLYGTNEENFTIQETPAGVVIGTQFAGSGKLRPLFVGADNTTDQALEITQNDSNVNYWLMQGAQTGVAPSLACRGSDSTVGCGIDAQGANTTTFTSHSFANTELQIFGNGGSSWLGIGSNGSDNPVMTANGSDSNINVKIQPKGTGMTVSTGPVQVPAYTVSTLPTCNSSSKGGIAYVTDASAPSYNSTLSGSGAVVTLAMCNGTNWTAH